MRINRRRALTAVAVGAVSLTMVGCGLGTGQPATTAAQNSPASGTSAPPALKGEITFQTWSLKNEKFTPYFEKLVADFEAANPGTKINWIDQPGDGYEDKIMQQVTAGQLPDVVNVPPGMAFQLAKVKKTRDLKAAAPDSIGLYTEGGIKAYEFNGVEGVHGYPWYLGTDLNWWNTKAFTDNGLDAKKLPTTMDELFSAAKTMAEKSGGAMPLLSSAPMLGDLAAAGVPLFEGGKFVFNSEDGAKVLQQYIDLYAAKAMPPEVLQDSYLGNSKLFMQGKVAWTTGSASFPVDLAKTAPTIAEHTVNSKRIGTPPLFVQGLSVAAESKNPDLALAFAQFATNNANQVEFVKLAQGFLPGTREANEKPETFTSVITDPKMKEAAGLLAESMKDARVLEPVEYTDSMKAFVAQQITAAMRGDVPAKEALDKAVKFCNDNLG